MTSDGREHQEDGMSEKTHIALPDPRRSWLMHCVGAFGDLGVCEIAVNDGALAIVPPGGGHSFELEARGIAQFRAAFDEAVAVAEADLRARTTLRDGAGTA
jgi:hypothetical protein